MPVSKYYAGHGREVMASMKREYGSEKGERVFYATANSTAHKPGRVPPTVIRQRRRRQRQRDKEWRSQQLFPRSKPLPASKSTRYQT